MHVVVPLFVIIVVFEISTAIHELAHMIMCKILSCRIIGMKVLFLYYNGQKWSVKLSGKNHCAFVAYDKRIMKKIVSAGPAAEMIVVVCSLVIAYFIQLTYIKIGFICAAALILISIVINLLPITNGDGKMLFEKEDD